MVFQLKAQKYPKMEDAYIRFVDFLKSLVCDFGKIDVEIHSVLAEKMNYPPFEHPEYITDRIHHLSLGATNFPQLGIVFRLSRDSEKFFLPTTFFHHCFSKQLEGTLLMAQKSKKTTEEVRFEISQRIKWIVEVRNLWWLIIKFLKLNK